MGVLSALAGLLSYPGSDYGSRFETAVAAVAAVDETAAQRLRDAGRELLALPLAELEELFTRTFDLNPVCAIEVGWQLYGEDYKRGAFLVQMRQELAASSLQENGELGDHLTNVLPLLEATDPERAHGLARACVIPAVEKMRAGIQRQEGHPFGAVIEAVEDVLLACYAPTPEVEVNS